MFAMLFSQMFFISLNFENTVKEKRLRTKTMYPDPGNFHKTFQEKGYSPKYRHSLQMQQ